EIMGLHRGECLHFAFSRSGPSGDTVASFTGLLRDGELKTIWHVIADFAVKSPEPGKEPELMRLPCAHAVHTIADTFVRRSPIAQSGASATPLAQTAAPSHRGPSICARYARSVRAQPVAARPCQAPAGRVSRPAVRPRRCADALLGGERGR